jgi:hypothetical protein
MGVDAAYAAVSGESSILSRASESVKIGSDSDSRLLYFLKTDSDSDSRLLEFLKSNSDSDSIISFLKMDLSTHMFKLLKNLLAYLQMFYFLFPDAHDVYGLNYVFSEILYNFHNL